MISISEKNAAIARQKLSTCFGRDFTNRDGGSVRVVVGLFSNADLQAYGFTVEHLGMMPKRYLIGMQDGQALFVEEVQRDPHEDGNTNWGQVLDSAIESRLLSGELRRNESKTDTF